ncbi:MAG: Lrp/AsnC family transcriptional regulator [Spirochaetaceae bacterium]|nr:Lrp/AsnC family transcriptional regulator [Spirochaetaceae bacterium]
MSDEKYEIDNLDKEIILELQEDARRQFKIIAGKLEVSEGTIKNRVERLIKQNILKLEARVNPFALPRRISAIVGVNLKERNHEDKIKEFEKIPGVTSVWNATGRFDLFFEVMVDSLESLNDVLFKENLKEIGGISYTETFVILSSNTKFFKICRSEQKISN